VSKSADKGNEGPDERAALKALEGAVGRLLKRLAGLTVRAEKAEARQAEVEDLLRRITSGDESPAAMHTRLREIEVEADDLRDRLGQGRETVERLLARIRFLEEQR
jgi:predicted nuclease with TOPRIM domain